MSVVSDDSESMAADAKTSRPSQDVRSGKKRPTPETDAEHAESAYDSSGQAESSPSEPEEAAKVNSGWKDSLLASFANLKEAALEKAESLRGSAQGSSKAGSQGAKKEPDTKKLVRNLKWALIVLPAICLIFLSWLWIKGSQAEKDYREMMAATRYQENLRVVEGKYQDYVSKHPNSRHTEEIGQALKALPDRIENREFEKAVKKTEELGEDYEEQEKTLKDFLSLHPSGKHMKQVRELLKEIPAKIAKREFFRLKGQLELPIQDLKKAENLVWEYLTNYPKRGFEQDAKALLEELPSRYEQQEFKKLNEEIEQLGDRYEEMAPLYSAYLGRHMYGANYAEVQERLTKIPDLIDDRDFRTIMDTEWGSLDAKMEALRGYLKTHPEGKHVAEAQTLIDRYPIEYAQEKKAELADLEERGRLEEAIALCREFMKTYPDHQDTPYFKNAIVRFERLLIPQRAGGDALAEINAYNSFIRRYPGHEETEKAKQERQKLVAEFEERTWSESLARAEAASGDPAAYSQALSDYLRLFPSGKYVQEARNRVANVEGKARTARAEDEWAKTLATAVSASSPNDGLKVLENYWATNPTGVHRKEAEQEIIRIELKRFQSMAPFASEEEPQKVNLKDGSSLTGTVRRSPSGQIALTSLRGDRYYLGPDQIKDLELTSTANMMRRYNEDLKQLTLKRPDAYATLAEWCDRNGFKEKALLLSVMAAYLNPAESGAVQRLKEAKFTYANGRWKSSDGLWR
ncbi:MAG: hypothetical protein HY788_18345 [Deltaproteobacteria bacterium]|nr:hypothetical protein [Deltaproteobacteria bacterium]